MGTHRHCGTCGAYVGRDPEHPCMAYREEPELPIIDPSFRVVPERTPEQLAESLRRVRRSYRDRYTSHAQAWERDPVITPGITAGPT